MSENIKQRKPRLILQSEIYIYIINILPAFLGKKIYIFPTVKSALLLLFNVTITLFTGAPNEDVVQNHLT